MRKHSSPKMGKFLSCRSLILIACLCLINFTAIGQNQQIHLQKKAVSLKEAFREIERQTNLSVDYDAQTVNVSGQASVPQNTMTVDEFLKTILRGTDYTYEFQGNHILIKQSSRQGTPKQISGTITDSKGEPVAGANVMIIGKNIGTSSDEKGNFSIEATENDILDISFIGFISEQVKVNGMANLNIIMREDTKLLDEVVVIGYGTTTRKNFTGSVSNVNYSNSSVSLSSRTNVMDALRGTVTGVTTSRETSAGSSPSILVHGQKSINSSNTNPLLVVDGVIFMGSWRDIDPSTVESISVLKDATSLAAYGSRAANGVIMITTKKGHLGKPVISFDGSVTLSQATLLTDFLSPEKFVEKTNLAKGVTDGNPQGWMKTSAYQNYLEGKTIDWGDYVLRTGVLQKYAMSVSGASEKFNYYVSFSHNDQKGVIYGDDYKREAITMRLQNDITKWLQVGTQINYTYNNYDGISAKIQQYLSPYSQDKRSNGELEKYVMEEGSFAVNPYWETSKAGNVDDKERYSTVFLKGHALVKCPWIEGLSYRLNAVFSREEYNHNAFYHESYFVTEGSPTDESRYSDETIAGYLSNARGYKQDKTSKYYVLDNILNYTHQFDKHYVDLTMVYTRDYYKTDLKQMNGSNFSSLGNTILGYNGLAYAEVQTVGLGIEKKTDIGYLARLNYSYNNRYHASLSVRRDGCSVFGSDKKWGVFPAVGIAWTVSEEEFMKDLNFLDYLKITASYGKNGNQSISSYSTLTQISLGQIGNHPYIFGNTDKASWGEYVTSIGNSELGWETTTVLNLGIDSRFLHDRIHYEMNFYKSKTTDQIFNRVIPIINNGFSSMSATMGQINNWGIEFTLNTTNISNRNFRWESMVNFYLNRNKLVDLYGDGKDDISNSLFIGKSLGAIYGYKFDGIVQEEDTTYMRINNASPGDAKCVNIDNSEDGKITPEDRTILGYRKENFRMNMSHTFTYKNFELYMMFTGLFGGNKYAKEENDWAYLSDSDVLNNPDHPWWTPENRSNKYPSVQFQGKNFNPIMSYWFIRLQDLNLSYNFKWDYFDRMGIKNLRLYFSIKNLFTITEWETGDPEVRQQYNHLSASTSYPLQRSYSIGLNLSF